MTIQLIKGEFPKSDALSLLSQLIQAKINFHEQKIQGDMSEEDIKYREQKIKNLQTDLHNLIHHVSANGERVSIYSQIDLD